MNALAYTLGDDVAFGAGQDSPATSEGKRLLAHELTHVLQQTHGAATRPASDKTGHLHERGTARWSGRVASEPSLGNPASVSFVGAGSLQRQDKGSVAGGGAQPDQSVPRTKAKAMVRR